jgi:hypothetical protein
MLGPELKSEYSMLKNFFDLPVEQLNVKMAYKCHLVEIYYHVKQILSCYYVATNVTK